MGVSNRFLVLHKSRASGRFLVHWGRGNQTILLLPATMLWQGNVFTRTCQEFCPQERGVWQGACVVGGVAGGMCGWGCAWQGARRERVCMAGCVCGHTHPGRHYEIRSMSGYVSYWNAFLLQWTAALLVQRCTMRYGGPNSH